MGAISFVLYNISNPPIDNNLTQSVLNMKNRGPDYTGYAFESMPSLSKPNINSQLVLSKSEINNYKQLYCMYYYHRLSINDNSIDGSQPFEDPIIHKVLKYPELRSRVHRKLLCNGEIYNYAILKEQENFIEKDLQSNSDVEIIMPLYIKYGIEETLRKINGDFAFVLTENINTIQIKDINIFVARDPLGIKPLYMVKYNNRLQKNELNNIFYMFVSEIKGIPLNILNDPNYTISEVPPGTYWSYQNSIINNNSNEFISYYSLDNYRVNMNKELIENNSQFLYTKPTPDVLKDIYIHIRELVTNAVISRFELSDQKIGILLSGGFDSSIILAILLKYIQSGKSTKNINDLHIFTVNSNTDDLYYTNKCIEYLETKFNIEINHHTINIDIDSNNIKSVLTEIIGIVETFEPAIINDAIFYNYILKYIKNYSDIKVLLAGDGLNELCGYSCFNSLKGNEFQNKSIDLLQNINSKRNDKLAGYYSIELRYPFFDISFIEYILQIHPSIKKSTVYDDKNISIEKFIIRKSFESDYLPYDVLWRGRQNISQNTLDINLIYSDDDYYNDISIINFTSNLTKEELYYKKIYNTIYPKTTHILKSFWKNLM